MGKVYKDKKSKGCALCKPHKHGWAPKKKAKTLALDIIRANTKIEKILNAIKGKGNIKDVYNRIVG